MMTECNAIIQLSGSSREVYCAYCHRAMIFGLHRRDSGNMTSDISSALLLRELGYAKGFEQFVDRVAAVHEALLKKAEEKILSAAGIYPRASEVNIQDEYERSLAKKRFQSVDRIPFDPSKSNEFNFWRLITSRFRDGIQSETNYIPVLCSYRRRIDAMVHLATISGDQVYPILSATEMAKHAVLRISDAIKSPLLLFAIQRPNLSLREFTLETQLKEDQSMPFPDEGLIVAYHLILDCEICSDCLVRWVLKNGKVIHFDRSNVSFRWVNFFQNLFVIDADSGSGRVDVHCERFQRQRSVCQKLHHVLLGGIEHLLVGESHVTFVPDRELFCVPFACLRDPTGQYLIEKMAFSVSPSLQLISEMAKQKENVLSSDHLCPVLLCGNPCTPRRADRDLLDVSQFVDFLATLPLSSPITVVTQEQFNTATLRDCCMKLRPNVVHIVSHGEANEDLSEDVMKQFVVSGSLLCSRETELSAMTVAESFDLKGIDLVFLNSCDLAVGNTKEVGVLGFNRAIFQAGCPSVISALWSVYHQISTAIAKTFYQCYFSGTYDKAQSLRQAILRLLSVPKIELGGVILPLRDCPVFWAPYQLFGNRVSG